MITCSKNAHRLLALALAGSWAHAALHLSAPQQTVAAGGSLQLELKDLPADAAAAAAPNWQWTLREAQGGVLTRISDVQYRFTAPDQPTVSRVRVLARNANPPYQEAEAVLRIAGVANQAAPAMAFFGQVDQLQPDGQPPLRIQAMRFLEAPSLNAWHRSTLLATDQGLFALDLTRKTTRLIPGTRGVDVPCVAVRPAHAEVDQGLQFAFVVRKAGAGRTPCQVWGVNAAGQHRLLAGEMPKASDATDPCTGGKPEQARLIGITAMAMDRADNVYVADDRTVWRIPADGGEVTLVAGSYECDPDDDYLRTLDRRGAKARFHNVVSMALDPVGEDLFVIDKTCIRKVSAEGLVVTILGRNYEGQRDWEEAPIDEVGVERDLAGLGGGLRGPRDLQVIGNSLVFGLTYEGGGLVAFDLGLRRMTTLLLTGGSSDAQPRPGPLQAFQPDLAEGQGAVLGQVPLLLASDRQGRCLVLEAAQILNERGGPQALVHLDLAPLLEAQGAPAGAGEAEEKKSAPPSGVPAKGAAKPGDLLD